MTQGQNAPFTIMPSPLIPQKSIASSFLFYNLSEWCANHSSSVMHRWLQKEPDAKWVFILKGLLGSYVPDSFMLFDEKSGHMKHQSTAWAKWKNLKKPFINKLIQLAADEEVNYLKSQGLYLWASAHAVTKDIKGLTACMLS